MGEGGSIWVGKDERHGVLAQPRSDAPRALHWRLEAIAHTPRPRSLTLSPDRRAAAFIEDAGDRSDVWLLDLEAPDAVPRRLTTGRDPMPYWEDTAPRISPDGAAVAYADEGHIWLVPAAGGPPRKLVEGGSPRWIGPDRLLIDVEREEDRTTRLAVVDVADPWPRRLATGHGDLDPHGDEGEGVPSPDGTEVAYTFTPRAHQSRSSEIRTANVDTGEVRRLTGEPDMHDGGPAWSPDGGTIAYASERSGFYELHLVGRDGADDRGRGPHRARLAPGRRAHRGGARGAEPLPRGVDRRLRRQRDAARERRSVGRAPVDRGRRRDRRVSRPRDAARAAPRGARRGSGRGARAGAALGEARPVRRARGRRLRVLRRPRDPGVPDASPERVRRQPGPRGRLSARRPDRLLRRRVGRPRAVLRRHGLRVARGQLPRLDRIRAR